MMYRLSRVSMLTWLLYGLWQSPLQAADYRKATEGRDVVMGKLYPKAERFEVSAPQIGFIMNQSYINTFLIGGSATYFLNENLGFSLDVSSGVNNDKPERFCIENFFYDPKNEVGVACGDVSLLKGTDVDNDQFPRYGPAYVPIREIQQVLLGNVVWTPVYGKQLIYLSSTSYFDLFTELGLGIVGSKYYPKQEILKNGNLPRGVYIDPDPNRVPPNDPAQAAANNAKIGALPDQPQFYGIGGRPNAQAGNNVVLNLGLGQKFHFGKMFHIKVYVRNMTLLGTDQGFENLLAFYGGIGVRF
jgi:outer membrane beta-barrel protein